jgi:hypothetical protein
MTVVIHLVRALLPVLIRNHEYDIAVVIRKGRGV